MENQECKVQLLKDMRWQNQGGFWLSPYSAIHYTTDDAIRVLKMLMGKVYIEKKIEEIGKAKD